MPVTDFDDLLNGSDAASTEARDQSIGWTGSPIAASEVEALLAPKLYDQLENGDATSVVRAAERATLHVASILGRLGTRLNLDSPASRGIVLSWTIYELHLGLGYASEGVEYRRKAKDLIIAAFGSYPDAEGPQEAKPAMGAVTVPRPRLWP